MAKKTGKKATPKGKAGIKVGIKEPAPPHIKEDKPTGKPPKWIKMLITVANASGCFITGHTYRVPHEVPVDTARRWVRSGAAVRVFGQVEPEPIPIGPKETK